MGQWSSSNIDTIIQVLECFYRALGLHINMTKSKLMGISVANEIIDQEANKIGCTRLKAPFFYLGSKVGDLMSRTQYWNDIINHLTTRLSKWKMKTLSIGGRLTLLKSVLGTIPIHHLSLFKAPMQVLRRMESIISHFFNGIDHKDKKPNPAKNITVSEKMSHVNLAFSFRRNPQGGIEHSQFTDLVTRLEGFVQVEMRDRWVWSKEGLGDFSVASVRKMIDDRWLPNVSTKTLWSNVVPIKTNVHAWKVRLDCLPTRLNISRRGMDIESILCPCGGLFGTFAIRVFSD
ncbi:hypothetical protein Tco_1330211 [Tanacetum coccineum]